MLLPQPIRLTRRGELLRAVSHAIRCLTQVPAGDLTAWQKDTRHFRKDIYSRYADVIQDIPGEFESWTSAADGIPADHQAVVEFLERLSYEIRRETCAYQVAGANSRCRLGFAFERVGLPCFESAAAQLFSLGSKGAGDSSELACVAVFLIVRFGCRFG